jgi:hypothetical protein
MAFAALDTSSAMVADDLKPALPREKIIDSAMAGTVPITRKTARR